MADVAYRNGAKILLGSIPQKANASLGKRVILDLLCKMS